MKTKLTKLQSGLLEKHIINLDKKIEEETFNYVRTCFNILTMKNYPDITVWISSKGGNAEYGLMIYDLLKIYSGKKRGVILGYAHSIASIILQACDTRCGLENSKMRIHFIEQDGVSTATILDQVRIKRLIINVKLDKDNFISIYKNNKVSKRKLESILYEDKDLSMEEALAFGFIDEIIVDSSFFLL